MYFQTVVLTFNYAHSVAPAYLKDFRFPEEKCPRSFSAKVCIGPMHPVGGNAGIDRTVWSFCLFIFYGASVWNSLQRALYDNSLSPSLNAQADVKELSFLTLSVANAIRRRGGIFVLWRRLPKMQTATEPRDERAYSQLVQKKTYGHTEKSQKHTTRAQIQRYS